MSLIDREKRPETRPETKEDRRARIFDQARRLIGENGFEGLSLRKLAIASGVTVPTIYNLIGGKDKILLEMNAGMVRLIEHELTRIDQDHPLEIAEAVVIEATRITGEDENFHRAALVASDHLHRTASEHADWRDLGRRAAGMQEMAARNAQKMGLLKGRISPALIGRQIFRNYQSASRDWAYRLIDLNEFRRIALLGVYLHLAADAAEPFHQVLIEKINALKTD